MMAPAVQKLPLAFGTCRLCEPPKSGKNRRVNSRLFIEGGGEVVEKHNNSIRLPSIVVLIQEQTARTRTRTNDDDDDDTERKEKQQYQQEEQKQNHQWFLCRYVGKGSSCSSCSSSSYLEQQQQQQQQNDFTTTNIPTNILCFDKSIEIISLSGDDGVISSSSSSLLEEFLGSSLEMLYPAKYYCPSNPTVIIKDEKGNSRGVSSSDHSHLQLLQSHSKGSDASFGISSDDDDDNNLVMVATLKSATAPSSVSSVLTTASSSTAAALSVSIMIAGVDSIISPQQSSTATTNNKDLQQQQQQQPLLHSAIKRQLVGVPLVFLENAVSTTTTTTRTITTRICVPLFQKKWSLVVKSVVAEKKQQQQNESQLLSLYLIVPSTRITLLFTNNNNINRISGDDLITNDVDATATKFHPSPTAAATYSPAAKLLIDTITCIRKKTKATTDNVSVSNTNNNINVPRAFLFSGSPGVGKTHAVRVAVEYCNSPAHNNSSSCRLISLQGAEIMAEGLEAARSLERHFQKAVVHSTQQRNSNSHDNGNVSVIFLDECDALLSADHVASMLAYLLDKVSSDDNWKRVVVVAATNRIDSVPVYLRRPGRFDKEVPLSPPNARERTRILMALLRAHLKDDKKHHNINEKELSEIAESCVGYVAADLELLVRKALLLKVKTTNDETSSLSTFLKQSMSAVGASALRDAILVAPPKTGWSNIAGDPGGSKTALQQAIEWPRTKSEAYRRLGLSAPRGILLHGPPGCAKTSLARAAAGASGIAFLSLSPADVFSSSYVGDAEAVVRRAFTLARSASPCVLFFDELDSIIGAEGATGYHQHGMSRGHTAEAKVLSTFLNEMDGVDGSWKDGVLVLAATNRPWTIDAALLRPGRFDKIIYVPPPDAEGRRSIFEMQCRQWQTDKPLDLDYLSSDELTANMTGAEIVGACRAAAMRAISESIDNRKGNGMEEPVLLKQENLEEALRDVQPLLSQKHVMREYRSFEEHRLRS